MSIRKQNLGDTIVELFEHLIALDKDVDTFDGHDTGGDTLRRISDVYMASKVREEGLMSEYGDIDDDEGLSKMIQKPTTGTKTSRAVNPIITEPRDEKDIFLFDGESG